jgi:branched-chain amino acid transport system ATP-binding protein
MNALSVINVSRHFGGVHAVADVSLDIPTGERRALIGTNGAGKTTLFNIVHGQVAPSSGRIELFGQDVTRTSTHERARLGVARTFQITSLFPRLTVFENTIIAVNALAPWHFVLHRPLTRYPLAQERAHALLERWYLTRYSDMPVRDLAYGTQRQLEIVMALAGEPRLLLLDEPMAGLSTAETALTADMIRSLDRSITVLLVEHDLAAAFSIADRVTAMDQGIIVADGTPDELRQGSSLTGIVAASQSSRHAG